MLNKPGAPSAGQLFATLVSLFEDQEGVTAQKKAA